LIDDQEHSQMEKSFKKSSRCCTSASCKIRAVQGYEYDWLMFAWRLELPQRQIGRPFAADYDPWS
jgi:hypothetical protein